jgi:AraC-like DNA-binding protein
LGLSDPAKLPFSLFTTEGLPAKEQFDAWRHNSSALFDVAPTSSEHAVTGFHARLSAHHLGGLIVAQADFDAQHFARTNSKLARDGIDHYQVQLYATGGLVGTADGRDRVLRPGDIQVLDLARPNMTVAQRSKTVALFVPRDLLNAALPALNDDLHGLVLQGSTGPGGLLGGYMQTLLDQAADMAPEQAHPIAHATVTLMAACLRPSAGLLARARPQVDAVLLKRMKSYINDNLASRHLNPDGLCGAFGVSRSRLYRLFEPLGGVTGHIQERRLARAMLDLTSVAGEHRRIIDIALDWGFLSEAHFSRQFRRTFGMPPSEARARLRNDPMAAAGRAGNKPSDPTLGGWITTLTRR